MAFAKSVFHKNTAPMASASAIATRLDLVAVLSVVALRGVLSVGFIDLFRLGTLDSSRCISRLDSMCSKSVFSHFLEIWASVLP